jgi:hypothetical protein
MASGRKVGVPKTTGCCPVGNAVASPKSIYEITTDTNGENEH